MNNNRGYTHNILIFFKKDDQTKSSESEGLQTSDQTKSSESEGLITEREQTDQTLSSDKPPDQSTSGDI